MEDERKHQKNITVVRLEIKCFQGIMTQTEINTETEKFKKFCEC